MFGAGRSRRSDGVKGDPSGARGGQAKHEVKDEDGVLTKSSKGDVGASDKVA